MKYQNQITKPKLLIETKLKIKIKEYILTTKGLYLHRDLKIKKIVMTFYIIEQ